MQKNIFAKKVENQFFKCEVTGKAKVSVTQVLIL